MIFGHKQVLLQNYVRAKKWPASTKTKRNVSTIHQLAFYIMSGVGFYWEINRVQIKENCDEEDTKVIKDGREQWKEL